MNKQHNFLFILLGIVVVGITCTWLYNNKLNDDFGINQLKQLRVDHTQLESEITLLDQDINELQSQLDAKKETKTQKVSERVTKEKKINDIEKAIFYLNKSLGRETPDASQ